MRWYVFCVQDGRDGAVAAAESGRPGADCCGHGGHHEGLQGKGPLLWSFSETENDSGGQEKGQSCGKMQL